jgi:hypothetical protein
MFWMDWLLQNDLSLPPIRVHVYRFARHESSKCILLIRKKHTPSERILDYAESIENKCLTELLQLGKGYRCVAMIDNFASVALQIASDAAHSENDWLAL